MAISVYFVCGRTEITFFFRLQKIIIMMKENSADGLELNKTEAPGGKNVEIV